MWFSKWTAIISLNCIIRLIFVARWNVFAVSYQTNIYTVAWPKCGSACALIATYSSILLVSLASLTKRRAIPRLMTRGHSTEFPWKRGAGMKRVSPSTGRCSWTEYDRDSEASTPSSAMTELPIQFPPQTSIVRVWWNSAKGKVQVNECKGIILQRLSVNWWRNEIQNTIKVSVSYLGEIQSPNC